MNYIIIKLYIIKTCFFCICQWQDVNPDNLMDSKLKCVFEWPVENNENTDSATDEFTVQEKVKKAEVKSSSKVTVKFIFEKILKNIELQLIKIRLRQSNFTSFLFLEKSVNCNWLCINRISFSHVFGVIFSISNLIYSIIRTNFFVL